VGSQRSGGAGSAATRWAVVICEADGGYIRNKHQLKSSIFTQIMKVFTTGSFGISVRLHN
jgi:hypothetical protein